MTSTKRVSTIFFSILITIAYGSTVIWLFEYSSEYLEIFSWSFIMLLPYAVGAIGNFLMMRRRELHWAEAIFFPWGYMIVLAFAIIAGSFGLLFCFIISFPILFPAASVGGTTVWLLKKHPKAAAMLLCFAIFSPFIAEPVEARFEINTAVTTTHTSVIIEGRSKTAVWNSIKAVPLIAEEEYTFNWFHWLGVPRPVEATLSHNGVGGVRTGLFENGLQFDEIITDWQLHEEMSFIIEESSDSLLPPPLDMIDGEYFDVLSGTYRLEELPNGDIRLHFISHHQLETRFNEYGSWWMDWVMRDLQNYILEIVKARLA